MTLSKRVVEERAGKQSARREQQEKRCKDLRRVLMDTAETLTLNDGTQVFGTCMTREEMCNSTGYGELYIFECLRRLEEAGVILAIYYGCLKDARRKVYVLNQSTRSTNE